MTEVNPNDIFSQYTLKALFGSGHRSSRIPNGYNRNSETRINIRKRTKEFIIRGINAGAINTVISGMAIGFDQDLAQVVLELKNELGGDYVRLICAIPFKGQEVLWKSYDQKFYNRVIELADFVCYVSDPGYELYKMHKRNQWMVDMSIEGIALWDGKRSGGTYECLKYAKSKNIRVFNLLEYKL